MDIILQDEKNHDKNSILKSQKEIIAYKNVKLNDSFRSVQTPAGMKEITLWATQEIDLAALLEVEDTRFISLSHKGTFGRATTGNMVVESSGCIYSSKLGSGKTATILALIISRPVPKIMRQHVNIKSKKHNNSNLKYNGFETEITTKFKKIMRPNMIVVRRGVILQWQEAIKRWTNFSVLRIGDVVDIKKFYDIYKEGKVNEFDIILVKAGSISGNFLLDGEDKTDTKNLRSIINTIGKICEGALWPRVIYDDYDKLDLTNDCGGIHGGFNIYISSTRDKQCNNRPVQVHGIEDLIKRHANFNIRDIFSDSIMYSVFRVETDPEFVDTCLNLPQIKCFKYVYKNKDDNYLRLIGGMGEDAEAIKEMINGDAINTAAETLGIKSNSVADMFEKVLDQKWNDYVFAGKVLEKISKLKGMLPELDEHPDGHHKGDEIAEIIRHLKKGRDPTIEYMSDNLIEALDNLYCDFNNTRVENGKSIERVKAYIKEGECQVCCEELANCEATFIIRCCGVILCGDCGIKGTQIQKRYNPKANGDIYQGICPNCRSNVNPKSDLIFVDKTFDLNKVLNARGDEKSESAPVAEEAPIEESPIDEIKNPKLKALLAIIRGKTPENIETTQVEAGNLIQGKEIIDSKPGEKKKILVFANFTETIEIIEKFLVEQEIGYRRLQGTYRQLYDDLINFKTDDTSVMLINSTKDCAGMNIQYASDLVFFHKIVNGSTHGQVLGRIQRPGRTCSANVHFLLYNNEQAV